MFYPACFPQNLGKGAAGSMTVPIVTSPGGSGLWPATLAFLRLRFWKWDIRSGLEPIVTIDTSKV
jgi:hypothetical protein